MMRRMKMVGLALLAGSFLAVGLSWAADAKDDKAAQRDTDVANIGLAMKLADLGRQADSPEALIGAAKILAKVKDLSEMKDVKPVEEPAPKTEADLKKAPKPGPVIKRDGDVKGTDFSEQIKKMIEEAKGMAKDDKALTSYIDSLKLEGSRGTVGGPRTTEHTVDVGKSETFTFRWLGGQQARVVVTGNGNTLVHVHRTPDGFLEGGFQGKNVELYWTPAKDNDFTVRITNTTGKPVKYSLFVN
jgi:hypothetical protein